MDTTTAWKTVLPHEALRDLIDDASSAVREVAAERGWPERIVDDVAPLHFAAPLAACAHLSLAHPGLVLPYDDDMPGPVLLEAGYLQFGWCPNGDFVAVDCVGEPGSVVYVSHEEFDYDDLDVAITALNGAVMQVAMMEVVRNPNPDADAVADKLAALIVKGLAAS